MSSINSRSVRTTKTDKSKSLCSGGVPRTSTPEHKDFDFSKELTEGHHTSLLWQERISCISGFRMAAECFHSRCCPLISFCCGETARAYALPDSAQKPGMIREAKGRIRANVSLSLSVVSQLKDDG